MRQLTIREIQDIELDIMKAFVKFCEDNQLTYMLCGGTLLGAVRHKGFIPWDDDIDLLMPRPDYDRLLNDEHLDDRALGTDIEIWHWRNGKSKLPFIKAVNIRTKMIPDSEYLRDCMEVGKIWIDIFPLDGTPDDLIACKSLCRRVKKYSRLLGLKMAKIGRGRTRRAKIFKPFVILALQMVPTRFLCRKIDSLSKQYSFAASAYVGHILWGWDVHERMKKEEFLGERRLEFEGDLYRVPNCCDKFLSGLYGNYMKLPPVAARKSHVAEAYVEEQG